MEEFQSHTASWWCKIFNSCLAGKRKGEVSSGFYLLPKCHPEAKDGTGTHHLNLQLSHTFLTAVFQTNPALILAGITSFKPAFYQSSIRQCLEDIQKSEHLFPWKACNPDAFDSEFNGIFVFEKNQ